MTIGFGSLRAAQAMADRARWALSIDAPVTAIQQDGRAVWAVELPELSRRQWKELREWKADDGK